MVQVNALGDTCPLPVIKTMNALKELGGAGTVEVLVDNEIAVQNLTRLAENKGCTIETENVRRRNTASRSPREKLSSAQVMKQTSARRLPSRKRLWSSFLLTIWAKGTTNSARFCSRASCSR